MKLHSFLLHRRFKPLGAGLFLAGSAMAFLRFYLGIKPEVLEIKTFAIYSVFLDSKFMKVISNNMSEEFAGLLLLSGLFFLAFSRDRNESATSETIRIKALFIAIYIDFAFMALSLLFTYGFAFVYMLMVNLFLLFFVYILVFRAMLYLKAQRLGKEKTV